MLLTALTLATMTMPERKKFNLTKTYKTESMTQKYVRVVAGQYSSHFEWCIQEVATIFISGLKGGIGYLLRKKIYPLIYHGFDRTSVVGVNVTLRCPKQIRLGAGVIVDDYCQLIANSDERASIVMGENTFIRSFAMLNAGPPCGYIKIGKSSSIGQSSIIYGHGGVEIGDNVMIAGQCFIVASNHNFDQPDLPMNEQGHSAIGISIGNNVWLGAGCKILDGVTIGEGSVIAANAVVNKNVDSGSIIGGIPGKVIGQLNRGV